MPPTSLELFAHTTSNTQSGPVTYGPVMFSLAERSCYSCACQLHKLPDISLPNDGHDEVDILSRLQNTASLPVQTISFLDLPAELRNRIYEHLLPLRQDWRIIATPFRDDLMLFGDQPAITRVSKQIRAETLEMFYATNTFVAYIQDSDFDPLVRWVNCITSSATYPRVIVEVKLLNRLTCAYKLLDLVRSWRDVKHQNIHVRIHNCYRKVTGAVFRHASSYQRQLVANAFGIAENLRQQGETTEKALLADLYDQFEFIDRCYVHSHAKGPAESCLFQGVGSYHPTRVRNSMESN